MKDFRFCIEWYEDDVCVGGAFSTKPDLIEEDINFLLHRSRRDYRKPDENIK